MSTCQALHEGDCTDPGGLSPEAGQGEAVVSSPRDYDPLFDRVLRKLKLRQAALDEEWREAGRLYRELLARPQGERERLVRGDGRFHLWALSDLLQEECHAAGFRDPRQALRLARLGVLVADRLSPVGYGARLVQDQRARAWIKLANVRRIRWQFEEAQQALGKAYSHLRGGSGDVSEASYLLEIEASLRGTQGAFGHALRLFDRAIQHYRALGERELEARTLMSRCLYLGYAGDAHGASTGLLRVLELLAPQARDLMRIAQHNLALCLFESGRPRESLAVLKEAVPLFQDAGGNPLDLLRLQWLEAKLAQGLGNLDGAEKLFLDVRQEFLRQELPGDVAFVALDLACLYATQGRSTEVLRTLEETLPILRSRGLWREALAAQILARRAELWGFLSALGLG